MKMAGCLSQGIVFPLSIMQNYGGLIHEEDGTIIGFSPKSGKDIYFEVGLDLTDIIGVEKWERPDADDSASIRKEQEKQAVKKFPKWLMRCKWFRDIFVYKTFGLKTARAFPEFCNKTDEVRIENMPWVLDKDDSWVLTEKVDGQSGTFAARWEPQGRWPFRRDRTEFYVCSRNRRLYKDDGSSYWRVYKKYDLGHVLSSLMLDLNCNWVVIQGEVIGPKIQGNKYSRTEPELYVFNLITDTSGRWSTSDGKRMLEPFGVHWVPIVGVGGLPKTVEGVLEIAHGKSQLADVMREGLVCRSLDGRMSFKAVDPEFLIHWGE